jgi:hypothetical protein
MERKGQKRNEEDNREENQGMTAIQWKRERREKANM